MTKTLLERLQDQFKKVGLTFLLNKETYYKYIGTLKDESTGYEMHTEIPKTVQVERVKQFAASERDAMNMYIKIQEMKKQQ